MGTTWSVRLDHEPKQLDRQRLRGLIQGRLDELESQLSHWRSDSAVSTFNRQQSTKPIPIPNDLACVISEALEVCELTGGAFDITVAPLVNLYGFGPQRRPTQISAAELAKARRNVGWRLLTLEQSSLSEFTLRKSRPEVQIDLSALAKGYAIDELAELLDSYNCYAYLIELGGELRGAGRRWRIGLESPRSDRMGTIRRVIALENSAVATSGNYRQFRRDAVTHATYSHIVDPREARETKSDLLSATVISETAMRADALATALMVMGLDSALEFAAKHALAVSLIDDMHAEHTTSLFQATIGTEDVKKTLQPLAWQRPAATL